MSDFEQGEIGPDLFRKVCEFGFEGLVSKRRDRPYRAGRSKHWIKVKNQKHPATERVAESFRLISASTRVEADFRFLRVLSQARSQVRHQWPSRLCETGDIRS